MKCFMEHESLQITYQERQREDYFFIVTVLLAHMLPGTVFHNQRYNWDLELGERNKNGKRAQ